MIRFFSNCLHLLKLLYHSDIKCHKQSVVFHYNGSVIHLDELGNLSIVPKGLLLQHCTYQEVLEDVGSCETERLCDVEV